MQKMIVLKNLRFGEEHKPPLNARRVKREKENIERLAASIDAHGLGQALNVVEDGKLAFVEDGNHRLAALQLLAERGNITADSLVKCEINEKAGVGAGELGLALNFERVPMHEADQYEKFYDLHTHGRTSAEIASRFGVDEKRVRKFLALGQLAPSLLDAWRNNELNRPTDILQAFTLAPNVKEQEAVYKRLKKTNNLWSNEIRAAFGRGDGVVQSHLAFVGADAFKQAGGHIIEDLFQEQHLVDKPDLLQTLAVQKFKEKLDGLTAEGWSWATDVDDLPYAWRYGWQKVPGGKKANSDDRARSGCGVQLKDDGTLEITYGLIKPEAQKVSSKAVATGATETAKEPDRLSGSLSNSLEQMNAKATQDALKAEAPASPLAGVLAAVAWQFIFPDRPWGMSGAIAHKMADIRNAISPPVMNAALKKAFDAERYFKGAPKSLVVKAIKEACGDQVAKTMGPKTKAVTWKYALEHVVKTGWLPPELRTSHYAGPGAKKPAEKPVARKSKVAEPA